MNPGDRNRLFSRLTITDGGHAVYNNTWSGLVPFNLLYYHRGEDYGAIPDLLEVVSSIDGKIVSTPVPEGRKGIKWCCN